jgi:TRAP-type mannitol/chloroaromatic compound transport system permease small subunit
MRQSIAVLIFFPPCGACIWWLLSRGWAKIVQGANISERTVKRQRYEFWILLIAAYALLLIQGLIQHKF